MEKTVNQQQSVYLFIIIRALLKGYTFIETGLSS